MAIVANFNAESVRAYIQQQRDKQYKAMIQTFQFAGETFVRNARINGNYQDITGNLRSSIGYILLQDGEQLNSNFEISGSGSDGNTGVAQGAIIAEQVAIEYPKGIVLICVAGMNYALFVEAKGLDVITESSLTATTQLKGLFKAI